MVSTSSQTKITHLWLYHSCPFACQSTTQKTTCGFTLLNVIGFTVLSEAKLQSSSMQAPMELVANLVEVWLADICHVVIRNQKEFWVGPGVQCFGMQAMYGNALSCQERVSGIGLAPIGLARF